MKAVLRALPLLQSQKQKQICSSFACLLVGQAAVMLPNQKVPAMRIVRRGTYALLRGEDVLDLCLLFSCIITLEAHASSDNEVETRTFRLCQLLVLNHIIPYWKTEGAEDTPICLCIRPAKTLKALDDLLRELSLQPGFQETVLLVLLLGVCCSSVGSLPLIPGGQPVKVRHEVIRYDLCIRHTFLRVS